MSRVKTSTLERTGTNSNTTMYEQVPIWLCSINTEMLWCSSAHAVFFPALTHCFLYVLGRASGADGVSMLSGMSETAVGTTVPTFCEKMVEDLYHVHVRLPEGDDPKEVMAQYRRQQFPGAMGSVDVTHVNWNRAPASEYCGYSGKERKLTLTYQATVDFRWRVLANSDGFAGAENDKTISWHDKALEVIRDSEPYTTRGLELYDASGTKRQRHGLYIIHGAHAKHH